MPVLGAGAVQEPVAGKVATARGYLTFQSTPEPTSGSSGSRSWKRRSGLLRL